MKNGFNNLTEEEQKEAEDALNPFAFENYCKVCIHFPDYSDNDGECPFAQRFLNGELPGDTEWKQIGCNNFWD